MIVVGSVFHQGSVSVVPGSVSVIVVGSKLH